jgi:hypothetical protein
MLYIVAKGKATKQEFIGDEDLERILLWPLLAGSFLRANS